VWRWIGRITSGMCMGVITQPWSDRITGRSACGIVEIASRTSQVCGLIRFPHSPSLPTLGSCVIGDKDYKGLSVFVRVQCREWRAYGEVKLFGSRKRVVASQRYAFAAQQHWLLPAQCTVRRPLCKSAYHFRQDSYLACTRVAFVLGYLLSLLGFIKTKIKYTCQRRRWC